jgi:translation initiation factor IF-2
MKETKVGVVVKYFAQPEVAAIDITEGSLKVGDKIHIHGHTTDFEQVIESMQIDRANVDKAEKGESIGIKVSERVRTHDEVFLVEE